MTMNVLHTNGTPGFRHNSASNVDRVMNALDDRYFVVRAMSVNRGSNKGKNAVPNGQGGRITLIPVLCVCPKGVNDAFKSKPVRPDGPDSFVGYGVGNGLVQGFDSPWAAIEAGNGALRSNKIRKWAKMPQDAKEMLSELACLRAALRGIEKAKEHTTDPKRLERLAKRAAPIREDIEEMAVDYSEWIV